MGIRSVEVCRDDIIFGRCSEISSVALSRQIRTSELSNKLLTKVEIHKLFCFLQELKPTALVKEKCLLDTNYPNLATNRHNSLLSKKTTSLRTSLSRVGGHDWVVGIPSSSLTLAPSSTKDWTEADEDHEDAVLWDDNWDDEDLNDEFTRQLR